MASLELSLQALLLQMERVCGGCMSFYFSRSGAITIQQGSLPRSPTVKDDVGTAPPQLYPQAAWPQLHVLCPIAETIQIPPHSPNSPLVLSCPTYTM